MHTRTLAVHILRDVLDKGTTLDAALAAATAGLEGRDQAFVQELCYGVLRWLPRLRYQLGRLLNKPVKAVDRDVEYLLLCGLYQILYLRTPDHAAVAASVDSSTELGKPWAGGLVNAVLRRAVREHQALEDCVSASAAAEYAQPEWLLKTLQQAWPEDWRDIACASNRHPPLSVRINARLTSRDDYCRQLAQAGLEGSPHRYAPRGLIITPAVPAARLPGFESGLVSVQDAAAQLAAGLLDLRQGQRVLDACAAPGGKTVHILEREPALAALVALDTAAERLQRVQTGLDRLRLDATLINADARYPDTWWDGKPFDRILLDAPCSGTGVIRRHPDIKYHRDTAAVAAATTRQFELLRGVWPLLACGGKLLYATCSVLPEENNNIITAFLEQYPDAQALPITAQWGRKAGAGRQILPGDEDMDGFFYACLSKN